MQSDHKDTNQVSEAQFVDTQMTTPRESQPSHKENRLATFEVIRHATAWIMIGSAVLFAFLGILATWGGFGSNAGDVIWRAFSSLAIIAFASLIINF